MFNRVNYCKNCSTASVISSCSECVEPCCQRRCNNTCCLDQCDLINNRTYFILKKICKKIFKDYNRAQCLQKYTIFDGGNSINVRIHRSGRGGDKHYQMNDKSFRDAGDFVSGKYFREHHQSSKNKSSEKYDSDINQSNPRENHLNDKTNDKLEQEKSQIGKYARPRIVNEDNDDGIEKTNQELKRSKKRRREYNDEYNNEKPQKGKGRFIQGSGKDYSNNNAHDIDETAIANQRRSKRNNKRGDDNKDKQLKQGKEIYNEQISIQTAKTQNKKSKKKYQEENENDYIRTNNDEKYVKKGKRRKGSKAKYNTNSLDIIGKEENKIKKTKSGKFFDKMSKKYRVSTVFKQFNKNTIEAKKNGFIIRDLRRKVRQKEKIGWEDEQDFNKTTKSKTLTLHQNIQNKFSRSDEVKACDHLRAQMEQRELCKLCCHMNSSHKCDPSTFMGCCCPNTVTSCFK